MTTRLRLPANEVLRRRRERRSGDRAEEAKRTDGRLRALWATLSRPAGHRIYVGRLKAGSRVHLSPEVTRNRPFVGATIGTNSAPSYCCVLYVSGKRRGHVRRSADTCRVSLMRTPPFPEQSSITGVIYNNETKMCVFRQLVPENRVCIAAGYPY